MGLLFFTPIFGIAFLVYFPSFYFLHINIQYNSILKYYVLASFQRKQILTIYRAVHSNQIYLIYIIIIRVKIQMSTVNRLKHKKKHTEQSTEQQPPQPAPVNVTPKYTAQKRTKCYKDTTHTAQRQGQYQSYYQISQCNPNGVTTTSSLFPHSHQMHSYYNIPLGFMCSPILALQNQNTEVMQKSADRIPRCEFCRAYMNCYNKIQKKKFNCFLCNRETSLSKDYNPNQQPNQQIKSPVYQAIGPANYYPKPPSQQTFVFLLDLNSDSAQTKMLYYAVAAMKQVFSRTQLDDLCIYFFTYDELIQEYDFTGQQIKCTVIDQSIQGQLTPQFSSCYLKDIREKLFHMLDTLEDISHNNNRKASNFTRAFDYVFNALKHTSAKFFIFQTNEAFINEQTFKQQIPKNINQNTKINLNKVQSLLQTKNKTFFDKYVNQILQNQCSFSFFVFSKNYKNLKTIHDVIKLSSSQLKVYSKDSASDLQKFYYDLSYLLGANYFTNLRTEYIISSGWNFTAIYGNFYRINQFITFQMNYVQPSRKIFALVTPSSSNQYPFPYCCIQIVTNYIYKRQSLICISTIVQPVTGQIDRLYSSIDTYSSITAISKGFLSSLRMDNIDLARKKITDAISLIYTCALNQFKKAENIPDSIMNIVMSGLAMLKSIHSQPELILNTPNFDKILGQRNMLQFAGINDLGTHFSPYLFDLSNLSDDMCRQDQQFVYPPTVQMKFNNVRDGLYLLDDGISLYLFIAKQCNPEILKDVFGKQKLTKNDQLNQQLLMQQESLRSSQVQYLIKFLREQKSYGWVPLHIIRCGQNTMNERNFYLHFYSQKYQEFRNYKFNLEQFLVLITKNNVV